MQALRGKVVLGKVVVEGEPLEEGARVTVLVPDKEHPTTGPRAPREEDRILERAGLVRDLGGEG